MALAAYVAQLEAKLEAAHKRGAPAAAQTLPAATAELAAPQAQHAAVPAEPAAAVSAEPPAVAPTGDVHAPNARDPAMPVDAEAAAAQLTADGQPAHGLHAVSHGGVEGAGVQMNGSRAGAVPQGADKLKPVKKIGWWGYITGVDRVAVK